MRGPLRWLEHRGNVCNAVVSIAALRIAEKPPHPSRIFDARRPLPARRGEVKYKSVLATHRRPSYANAKPKNRPAEQDRVTPKPAVGPAFGAITLSKQTNRKGSGTPADAYPSSAPYGRGSREASRARLSAFHHGACCSDRTPQLSSSYALPGTGSERTTPMVRKIVRLFRGRYPHLPVPVQRVFTRRPVIVPAGRILPKPPGSGGDEPPPAGTTPAPPAGVAGCRPFGERDSPM